MFRFVNSDPALVEAHARTQEAMRELELAIRAAFERYDQLAHRLEGFDGRLQAARVRCHAEPVGNGYKVGNEPARVAGADPNQESLSHGGHEPRARTFSKLPAPA
jgi:hypothetical protein